MNVAEDQRKLQPNGQKREPSTVVPKKVTLQHPRGSAIPHAPLPAHPAPEECVS
jgi:hypothetical protein